MKAQLATVQNVEYNLTGAQSAHNVYHEPELTHFNCLLSFLMHHYGIS